MSQDKTTTADLLSLTTDIVASHVSNNVVPVEELPQLITLVFESLAGIAGGDQGAGARPAPAVPIKKSITPDFLVCLEDGVKLKMMKRHLKTRYNMTPDDYRRRWGLPADYPMVAPNYAERRRALAREIGLGSIKRKKTS